MDYIYLDGLAILHYLKIDLDLSKIGDFRRKFEFYYQSSLVIHEKIESIALLAIVQNAYSSAISNNNKNLENELKDEFFQKTKSSDLITKLKSGVTINNLDKVKIFTYLN